MKNTQSMKQETPFFQLTQTNLAAYSMGMSKGCLRETCVSDRSMCDVF
ncbi:MAG: hypothetical protein AB3N13_00785 [Arenibacterium sp.]